MRILTWNIVCGFLPYLVAFTQFSADKFSGKQNGIRTLPQYHPWNTLKTMQAILDHLEADIICFQEMKTTRQTLTKDIALPPSYHSFFSFPQQKGGYSGVAVYSRTSSAMPLGVEEGLSGTLPAPKNTSPPYTFERGRVSSDYPLASSLPLFPVVDDGVDMPQIPVSLTQFDTEGRALVVDYGLFVLINLYCPNESSDARFPFKMNYHLMLEDRVRYLVEVEKRDVVVVGDINICAAPIDHCEGYLQTDRGCFKIGGGKGDGAGGSGRIKAEEMEEGEYMEKYVEGKWRGKGFWRHPAREWLRRWIDEETGMMVDVLRKLYRDRKGMYTCWNTKIGARATNYGTRIDYILVTHGLLPWIKGADILPEVKGSDHCPVWMDLHEEIEVSQAGNRTKLKLSDMIGVPPHACSGQAYDSLKPQKPDEPPPLAAKWWNEFSGKQMLLSNFFGKGKGAKSEKDGEAKAEKEHPDVGSPLASELVRQATMSTFEVLTSHAHTSLLPQHSDEKSEPVTTVSETTQSQPSQAPLKRKLTADAPASNSLTAKKAKSPANYKSLPSQKQGQAKLSTFFRKPGRSDSGSGIGATSGDITAVNDLDSEPFRGFTPEHDSQIEADYQFALELTQSSSQSNTKEVSKNAWSTLLAPIEPPRCIVHDEPAKEYTVNKPGVNKGKKFFICSRPVGPGYDKGKGERLREDVNPQWKCNFFKWSSEVRKERERSRSGEKC